MSVHETAIDVRFGDTDMFGHVNNAAFATFAETARLTFLRDVLGGTPDRPGGDMGGVILARIAIDFRQQLLFGQSASVATEIERIGNSSITLVHQVISDGQVVADISSVVVAYDYEAQRPKPIPDSVRELLAPYNREAQKAVS